MSSTVTGLKNTSWKKKINPCHVGAYILVRERKRTQWGRSKYMSDESNRTKLSFNHGY